MGGFYGLKAATAGLFKAIALLCPASEQLMLDALDTKWTTTPTRADRRRRAARTDSGAAHRPPPMAPAGTSRHKSLFPATKTAWP